MCEDQCTVNALTCSCSNSCGFLISPQPSVGLWLLSLAGGVPESPRFLVAAGRLEEADAVLAAAALQCGVQWDVTVQTKEGSEHPCLRLPPSPVGCGNTITRLLAQMVPFQNGATRFAKRGE